MTETDIRNGAIGGQLGTAAPRDTTFHGSDPATVASDSTVEAASAACAKMPALPAPSGPSSTSTSSSTVTSDAGRASV